MVRAVTIELNELDFELLQEYARAGHLPTFRKIFSEHDIVRTVAEKEGSHLEPWIQWVTAHTGLTFAEHGVFRLGDIVYKDFPQIWEVLEERFDLVVGAISPMNAKNNLKRPAFFVPDPWTRTSFQGPWHLSFLTEAVTQAVNDNAHDRIMLGSYARLAAGAAANVRLSNLWAYLQLALTSSANRWRKALFLDLLLSDAFINNWLRYRPDYASLFLNAGAHVQHHYWFSSPFYRGEFRNPGWYVNGRADPVEEVYRLYDRILGNVMTALPDVRLLICTGLSQTANTKLVCYYRPKDHLQFLSALGVERVSGVLPRMSRDFLIEFPDRDAANAAEAALLSFRARDGTPIFSVENRGTTLFCMLSYTGEIAENFTIAGNGRTVDGFQDLVSLVSIENAVHRTVGYFIDCGLPRTGAVTSIPLTEVFRRTLSIWGGPPHRGAA